jgi:hypothetical protein
LIKFVIEWTLSRPNIELQLPKSLLQEMRRKSAILIIEKQWFSISRYIG